MRRGPKIAALGAALSLIAALALAPTASAAVPQATLTPGGRAVAPASAPPAVKAMIEAANRIRHRPYRWGGGHRSWNSAGYDCSGSVSYVMHAAGLLESPLDSTGFMEGIEWATYARDKQLAAMAKVREAADKLERVVADDFWPLPKYEEMLFIK